MRAEARSSGRERYFGAFLPCVKASERRRSAGECNDMRLKQLDGWLANRMFIATDDFTEADILMTHVLSAVTEQGLLKPYQHVRAYQTRCTERHAWKRAFDAYCERVEGA